MPSAAQPIKPSWFLPYWAIYAYAGGDRWTRVIFRKSAFFDGHCQVVAESRYRNVGYMWLHVTHTTAESTEAEGGYFLLRRSAHINTSRR